MLKSLIRSYLINLFALWITASYIGSFHLTHGLESLLVVSLGFTLLYLIVVPIIHMIVGSINFLTLGLLGLAIDSAILYLLTLYFPQITISPWSFSGASFSGFVLPPFEFTLVSGTVLSALIINIIRRLLTALAE